MGRPGWVAVRDGRDRHGKHRTVFLRKGRWAATVIHASATDATHDLVLIESAPILLEKLSALIEYAQERADVLDGQDGPIPNWAMRLLMEHEEAVRLVEKLNQPPKEEARSE